MIKSAVIALSLGAVSVMGVMQASAATDTNYKVMTSQSAVYGKKLTKAQCLQKDGYTWSSSKKRCVKDTRGSH